MARYTSNQLRAAMEVGNTSQWTVVFENVPGAATPDASRLNFIKTGQGDYSTVQNVSYDQAVIKKHSFTLGPGLEFSVPVFQQRGTGMSVTFFDNHFKEIRGTLLEWVRDSLSISNGKAPTLNGLKQACMLLRVSHHSKQSDSLSMDDVFYVVPDESIAFLGDQDFSADTVPVKFNIIGTQ